LQLVRLTLTSTANDGYVTSLEIVKRGAYP
jgi:hypothetical protein